MICPYFFTVRYYEEVDGIVRTSRGVLFAASFIEAMAKLGDYYGEKNIDLVHMSCSDESSVLELSPAAFDAVCKSEFVSMGFEEDEQ